MLYRRNDAFLLLVCDVADRAVYKTGIFTLRHAAYADDFIFVVCDTVHNLAV